MHNATMCCFKAPPSPLPHRTYYTVPSYTRPFYYTAPGRLLGPQLLPEHGQLPALTLQLLAPDTRLLELPC